MRNYRVIGLLACLLCLFLSSCQKVSTIVDEEENVNTEGGSVIQFNITRLEQLPFNTDVSSRSTDVKAACKLISLAVYQNNKKIQQVNQTSDDAGYGSFKLNLVSGDYQVVLIAHNGTKAPTMTDVNNIPFDGNKVTDTFYYCDSITVDGNASHDLTLKRAVAMYRHVVIDQFPSNVARMYFYYTGGSSTFDAVKGVGCVNSRQSLFCEVTSDMHEKGGAFELYTFPRVDSNALKMKVVAMDSGDNTVKEMNFSDVEISRNTITQYKGSFFGGPPTNTNVEDLDSISFELMSDDEWRQVDYTY